VGLSIEPFELLVLAADVTPMGIECTIHTAQTATGFGAPEGANATLAGRGILILSPGRTPMRTDRGQHSYLSVAQNEFFRLLSGWRHLALRFTGTRFAARYQRILSGKNSAISSR
jgi:hypothetical protein